MSSRARGFTLLELIVAVAVFSLMAVTAYAGLRNFIATQTGLEAREFELAQLQMAVAIAQQDFENAIARPVRDAFGDDLAAMSGGEAQSTLELTRRRPGLPPSFGLPELTRVDYYLEAGQLRRRSWEVLDRTPESASTERILLNDVEALSWRFYGDRWFSFWPLARDPVSLAKLPRAIEMRLRLAGGREIRRLVLLANQ